MAIQKLDVEKFAGENDFHLWRLKMRALLVHQGIEEVLEDPRTSKKISKVKDEDMQDAMDKAHNTIILNINVKIEYEDKAIIMFSSLPPSYEHFVDTLLYDRQSLAMQDVKEALSSKESSKKSEIRDGDGLTGTTISGDAGVVENQEQDKTLLWHFRLGHVSENGLKELEKQGALWSDKISVVGFDEECVLGKSSRTRFKTVVHNTKGTLDYIHSDLWGPSQIESLDGACYFLSMIDDFSRIIWMYPLRSKDKVVDRFKAWKTLIETQTNRKVRRIRTDNGLEFCNKQFDDLCEKNEILRHNTVRHTPQQNDLVERMNRTLMERVRCMLFHSKLPKTLWAEALCTACYLINICPSTAIEFKTPYEVWSGKLAHYSKLRIFGCIAYAHIKQGKLDPRALKCAFLGYPNGTKGYKLWCTDLKPPKCIISRDVTFNESEMLKSQCSTQCSIQKIPGAETPHFEVELSKIESEQNTNHTRENEGSYGVIVQSPGHMSIQDYQLTRDRQKRQVMEDEMDSLNKNGTWELIQKPEGRKIVSCKWVYKIKDGIPNVEPKRFKARLVAKGFTQREGIDYTEVFSPVVRHTSIKIILSLVVVYDMHLEQLDVKTAFLHGDLKEEIVMSQPEGFMDIKHPNWVYLLKKISLWAQAVSQTVVIYLVLYVDDMLLACKNMKLIDLLKQQLKDKFDMKDLGPAKKILGVELVRNRITRILFMSQEKYVNKVLEKFGMMNCKPMSIPMAAHFKLSSQQCPSTESEQTEMLKTPYASSVSCLMYAMVLTRPDLSYAVNLVSKFMSNPGKEHWRAVKWILKYLRGTTSYGLLYGKGRVNYNLVEGFVDSDYAGDLDNRRSLTGFLFTLNNCTISCQSAISLSKIQVHHEKTKHIDIKLHFIRLEVSKGTVKLMKIHTSDNVADMLTKPVPMAKFEHCLDLAALLSLMKKTWQRKKGNEEKKKSIALKASKYESDGESEPDDEELAMLARRYASLSGKYYAFVIVDDFLRYTWVLFLANKDDALDAFKVFCKKIQNGKGYGIACIRSDHGGEFENYAFETFYNNLGIVHQFSSPKTPQKNGVVERKNRSIQEMARTMLNENSLPKYFWAEAINTACYVLNRVLIRPYLNKTPYELWKDRKPNIGYLKVFLCKCFILNTKDNLGKFDPKSDVGIFHGYSNSSKTYRVYNKRTLVVEESMHVTFDESNPSYAEKIVVDNDVDEELQKESSKDNHRDAPHENQEEQHEKTNAEQNYDISQSLPKEWRYVSSHPKDLILGDHSSGITTRSSFRNTCEHAAFISQIEPKSFADAANDESWIMAMQE
ncbi:Integrase catalytic domain-containing protein [Citrus sinensis]|uniref:Integrase catalytic domain-containing protein n=1 Tax=Citrus sinensis TaxID=2711 RepID=A0ACB8L960_CITSI|nr:Integrase catalytic domain-containing protein [Citrus sinensis]